MDKISERVMALSPSATFAMSQKAADLKATGLDVISLSVGEPDFNTPDHIKEAAKKAIDDNFSFYTPVPGYLSLREAICRKLKRENGLDFTPAQIVVGNGAKQELCDVILSVVNKGEEVLIPVPAWVSYMEMVKIAEGVPVLIYAGPEQKFKVTPQQLEAAITPKTKAVLICSPSNPTGSVYSKEELQGLVDVLAKYPDIIVIADEIYEHITYVGPTTSLASFPEIKDRVVVINGVSKAYAMTGWRIGYCAAPLPIAKAVSELHGQYTSNCSSIAQKAAEFYGFSYAFSDYRNQTYGCCFLIHHTDRTFICNDSGDGGCFCITGNCDHVQSYGADTGHCFQFLECQGIGFYGINHTLVFTDRNECTAESADIRRGHNAAFFHLVI